MTKHSAWTIFAFSLLAALIAEFFIISEGHFGLDGSRFFHAWFGFAACVVVVLVSKLLGLFLSRRETYYGKHHD